MNRTLTVDDVARALHCDERKARKYLREVNSNIGIYLDNPGEPINRQTLIDLCIAHEGTILGRRLLRLLGKTADLQKSPKPSRFTDY